MYAVRIRQHIHHINNRQELTGWLVAMQRSIRWRSPSNNYPTTALSPMQRDKSNSRECLTTVEKTSYGELLENAGGMTLPISMWRPTECCCPRWLFVQLLWPPCVADADIIFLPVVSFFFFYSSPNLSGRRLDVYHTSTHGVALVRI